jgi:hypothetical protein
MRRRIILKSCHLQTIPVRNGRPDKLTWFATDWEAGKVAGHSNVASLVTPRIHFAFVGMAK